MKRLVLIDAHAVIHRAFHALPPLTSPAGEPVQAVYGFASVLLKMLRELKPDYVAATFDHEGPTFRHVAFERYKATRVKAPDALYQQIPVVKELVAAFGIPALEQQGYEADDLIGTVASAVRRGHPEIEIIIVTGDLDTLQLVDAQTKVFTMRKGVSDTVLYDVEAVRKRYGFSPKQLIDFKGLRGDPSDNIPGVKGIGEKTASELIGRYGSIEEVYRALKRGELKAKPGAIAALQTHQADALFSKTLATIDRNAPIKFVLASSRLRKAGQERGRAILERLGFESLLRRMGSPTALADPPVAYLPPAPAGPKIESRSHLADIPRHEPALILWDSERKAVVVAVGPEQVFAVPVRALTDPAAERWFKSKPPVYIFNAKLLCRRGLNFDPGRMRDLALMWYLLEPGRRSYEPAMLALKELRGVVPPATVADTARSLLALIPRLEDRLRQEELSGIYAKIESPLIPILAAMEERGIGFNSKPLRGLSKKMAVELHSLEGRIHAAAGGPFNINSPRKLADLLFVKLGLAPKGIRRTEKLGAISTRESELLKLKSSHPVVADILGYRELAKLKSTYVDALPKLVSADGRIRTTWNQMGTATGRLASSNPNLQNIPARSGYGLAIRKAFLAAQGFELAAFDYSQLELRIAADLAQDQKMMEAFGRGLDIHRLTAAELNNVPIDKVTPDLRNRAKTLNFGVLYGMGARALAESAGISRDEAEHFIEEYFRDFSGIARFVEETKAMARELGYTKTFFGRRRFFPELGATNFRLQREAERQAVNFPVQGTAADIAKKAMIEAEGFIRARNWANQARLLLQIHDELIFEIKKDILETAIPEIRKIMEQVWPGKVPMKVEVKRGGNWGELAT